jgi:asparagine synthase (glutamine-hydrolysing)
MLETLAFRGPDESSTAVMGSACLGHTRLSIIDLQTGAQPIYNEDRSVAVLLNGEIYNYQELREQLRGSGHLFRTTSDTEVIVHLYEEVGEHVFTRLNGMFAILIYDSKTNTLLAGRDRIGEKPLLYWDSPGMLAVSSELKALLQIPAVEKKVDREALALYLNCMYVPAPHTIFRPIQKLLPAHYLKVCGERVETRQYWQPEIAIDWNLNEEAVTEEFIELFSDSVRRRIVADVPIGVFLSGGVDSGAITAFMSKHCQQPVRTFCIGFSDEIDERSYARMVAEKYKTDHTEILVNKTVQEDFDTVMAYFDEPFADSSAIPTYIISREARNFVKVILTGDGGDEVFAGYPYYIDQKYQLGSRLESRLYKALNRLSIRFLKNGLLEGLYPISRNCKTFDPHWHWIKTVFTEPETAEMLPCNSFLPSEFFRNQKWLRVQGDDALSAAFSGDLNFYLPDDLLKKVDMASMLCGLECRAPFLDHRQIEFSLRLPPQLKVKNDRLKHIVRKALGSYLPSAILDREKIGFGAPIESWLNKQLKDMTRDLLRPGCKCESWIGRKMISGVVEAFYGSTSRQNWLKAQKVWSLVALEVWMLKYLRAS